MIAALAVIAAPVVADAQPLSPNPPGFDVPGGQIFGFRIGTPYEPSADDRAEMHSGGYFRTVYPAAASKPADLGPVSLVVTARTGTILSISTENVFSTTWEANQFATRYANYLRALTGLEGIAKEFDYQRYRQDIGPYLLTLNVVMKDDRTGLIVMINLKDNRGNDGPLMRQAEREWNEVSRGYGQQP